MIEGPNFFFGRDRAGGTATLREYCDAAGLRLTIVEPVKHASDGLVSSSMIRRHIADGKIEDAVRLLGHPFQLQGIVAKGAERGRSLGFATANLSKIETLLPKDGVYGACCTVDDRHYRAAVNIGANPTFCEEHRKVEVHLLDFEGQLYGSMLSVDLLTRIRETKAFDSVEQLKNQIQQDVDKIRASIQPDTRTVSNQ